MATPYEVLRFEGDFYFFRINDDGSETPVLDRPVELEAAITQYEEGETRTVLSKGRGRYNQAIYSEQDPGVPSLQVTANEFPPDFKALLFAGELTTASESGAAIVDELHTDAPAEGQIVKLGHGNISASPTPVVTNGGATTYVAGTDYTIDREFGILKILEGSAINEGQTFDVSYTYTATTVITIDGGVKPQQRFRIIGYLRNRPTNRDAYLEVYDVALARSGDTDILAAEALKLELAGAMTVPAGKTAPFRYIERKSAA